MYFSAGGDCTTEGYVVYIEEVTERVRRICYRTLNILSSTAVSLLTLTNFVIGLFLDVTCALCILLR